MSSVELSYVYEFNWKSEIKDQYKLWSNCINLEGFISPIFCRRCSSSDASERITAHPEATPTCSGHWLSSEFGEEYSYHSKYSGIFFPLFSLACHLVALLSLYLSDSNYFYISKAARVLYNKLVLKVDHEHQRRSINGKSKGIFAIQKLIFCTFTPNIMNELFILKNVLGLFLGYLI